MGQAAAKLAQLGQMLFNFIGDEMETPATGTQLNGLLEPHLTHSSFVIC
ncbi:hypothetical protein JCM19237_3751 [Photobacterium aphoticum]|uniref:Uncharacterized protein n=1 Tax=Photobacterium aphoticum TaxID=754436 RepID=A0A090R2Q3_9GAMM|nr:hypothetical protein JCM19237_3751 [Photobacterium aphoticum]